VGNFRFIHIGVRAISGNADIFTEISKSGCEMFVWQDYHSTAGMNRVKKLWL
jgi:hypothetical protein